MLQSSGLMSDESISGVNGSISTLMSCANSSGTNARNVSVSAGCKAPLSGLRTIEMVPPVSTTSIFISLFNVSSRKGTKSIPYMQIFTPIFRK